MKLRNKMTGEIRNAEDVIIENLKKNGSTLDAISIDEIREEWEDYHEEPKGYYYYIDEDGVIQIEQGLCSVLNMRKSIGNYFATKEEAEKACDKLKAWKRLKDKGFRFDDFCANAAYFTVDGYWIGKDEFAKDMKLLFGGEE